MMRRPATIRGFTLVELLITIVVIGILSSIAYPSYTNYLRKARRAEAQQVLMDGALRQQQILLDSKAYVYEPNQVWPHPNAGVTTPNLPASVKPYYQITVDAKDESTTTPQFKLRATPIGTQATDSCGVLTVDHANTRTPANCW